MAQDHAWTDDTFAGGHVAQTDLQNMENNFLALKTNFTGDVAPSSPEEGQTWTDTDTKIIKKYDGASWQNLFDYGNVKMAVDTVQTTSIKNVNVTAAKLATDAVETVKIKNGNVTPAKLSSAFAGLLLIKTDSYVGNGSTSNAITGVGFQPKYVKIWRRATGAGDVYEKSDTMGGESSVEHDRVGGHTFRSNRLIALGADGFTVDDGGSDFDPNASGITYDYLALGAIV